MTTMLLIALITITDPLTGASAAVKGTMPGLDPTACAMIASETNALDMTIGESGLYYTATLTCTPEGRIA